MLETIQTPEGQFTAEVAGAADGPLVLLLHGYPQTRHTWREQVPALGAAGYHAVAPDQRGYSAGVRPDPAAGLAAYGIDRLVADVLDLAAAKGHAARPFHLVGVLSRPHPAAFRRAFREDADNQKYRSRHHKAFLDPNTATRLLEDGGRRLRRQLRESRVREAACEEYLSVLGHRDALEAALSWYRAAGALASMEVGTVTVPTLYIWGDEDDSVGRSAAAWTAEHVTGPYRFEVIPGIGHFITDQIPAAVTRLLLSHLAASSS